MLASSINFNEAGERKMPAPISTVPRTFLLQPASQCDLFANEKGKKKEKKKIQSLAGERRISRRAFLNKVARHVLPFFSFFSFFLLSRLHPAGSNEERAERCVTRRGYYLRHIASGTLLLSMLLPCNRRANEGTANVSFRWDKRLPREKTWLEVYTSPL